MDLDLAYLTYRFIEFLSQIHIINVRNQKFFLFWVAALADIVVILYLQ